MQSKFSDSVSQKRRGTSKAYECEKNIWFNNSKQLPPGYKALKSILLSMPLTKEHTPPLKNSNRICSGASNEKQKGWRLPSDNESFDPDVNLYV